MSFTSKIINLEATPAGSRLASFGVELRVAFGRRHFAPHLVDTGRSHRSTIARHFFISCSINGIDDVVVALDNFLALSNIIIELAKLVTSLVGSHRVSGPRAAKSVEHFLGISTVSLVSSPAPLLFLLILLIDSYDFPVGYPVWFLHLREAFDRAIVGASARA